MCQNHVTPLSTFFPKKVTKVQKATRISNVVVFVNLMASFRATLLPWLVFMAKSVGWMIPSIFALSEKQLKGEKNLGHCYAF